MKIHLSTPVFKPILLFRGFIAAFLLFVPVLLSAQISFLSQNIVNNLTSPTSLQFGPDDRLYVSQQNGTIKIYTINRVGAGNYQVTNTETIDLIKTHIPNYNDDGSSNTTQKRQVTGILVKGTAQNPILYVTSSDWRIAVGNDANLDTNSGIISRLTWVGNGISDPNGYWDKVDIVRGFPRSEENHSVNGLVIDDNSNTLYLMVGGITNKGAPGNNFSGTPEYALSAAMVSVNLNAINSMPVYTDSRTNTKFIYDIPTLDDPSRSNITNSHPDFPYPSNHPSYNSSIDPGDPFGGNNGLNQARWVPGGPVQVYSGGYRNAYDVVLSESGKLYTYDNGPNGGWGGLPKIYTSNGTPKGTGPANWQNGDYASNEFNESSSTGFWDHLHYVSGPGYYAGHPNPTRANPQKSKLYEYNKSGNNWNLVNTYDFFNDFPDPPVTMSLARPQEAEYKDPSVNGSLVSHWASTNGLAEYTASNFNNALKGDLLAANFNDVIFRIDMNGSGTQVNSQTNLVSAGNNPLDVTAQGDNDIFPGTIWVAVHGGDQIKVFEPTDYNGGGTNCTGVDDPNLDEDNDGYSNADEIDNGTDPCSQGSVPPDYDGDFISNLNDNDDDNDGMLDTYDPFAIDPNNGLATNLNVLYGFSINNGDQIPGTLFGLGFTGLMTNGNYSNSTPGDDYQDMYNETNLNLGGATSKLGVEGIGAGTAQGNNDNQENAFQFGLNVDNNSPEFTIHSRVESPYFLVNGNPISPINNQSKGIYLGNGDQDNYLKIVMNAQNGNGGIEVALEVNGSFSSTDYSTAVVGNILASTATELYLDVNPGNLTVQPKVSIDGGNNVITLGSPISVPASWFSGSDNVGLAIGVISTSFGSGTPFDATWDLLNVTAQVAPGNILYRINAGGAQVTTIDAPNPNWEADQGNGGTQYRNGPSNTSNHTVPNRDASVPAEVPQSIFQTERWDPSTGDEMKWFFSMPGPGTYEVRLYFANGYGGTSQPGQRVFNVEIEGAPVLTNYDIAADVGHQTGVMKSFFINVSDGTLNIDFYRVVENPIINGIEIRGGNAGGNSGTLSASPASINFGSQDVNTTSGQQTISMSNTGSGDLLISSVNISGADAAMFSHNFTSSVTLSAGGNQPLNVTFTPTSTGAKNATLEITHDGTNTSPLLIPLSGTGNNNCTNPSLSITSTPETCAGNDGTATANVTGGSAPYTYQWDAAAGSQTTATASGLSAGTYSVTVTDNLGCSASGNVTVGNSCVQQSDVLYRINAGGGNVSALDSPNPNWEADQGSGGTQYRNGPSNTAGHTVPNRHSSVPAEVPQSIFQSERWDPSTGDEMKWFFNISDPGTYEVRLFFANGYGGTSQPGQRVFNVEIEGAAVLTNYDIAADVGHQTGVMKSFNVNVTDGTLNIDFYRVTENPLVNGIEILGNSGSPSPGNLTASPTSVHFFSQQVGTTSAAETVTLNNTGGTTLTVSNIALTGAHASEFSHNASTPVTLAAGASTSVNITFSPTSAGSKDAAIEFTHDGANGSPVSVSITGEAIVPNQVPTSTPIPDITVAYGSPSDVINLHNYFDDDQGDANLTYSVQNNTGNYVSTSISSNNLTVTYPSSQTDVADITVRATDQNGNYAEETFTVTVIEPVSILYRINAGGPMVPALDGPNPDWEADQVNGTTQYHNSSSYTSNHTVPNRDGTVTAEVPQQVFQTERWDHSSGDEMKWFFNVPGPGDYNVKLYFANGYHGTSQVGQRVFNVQIEGSTVLSNFDIVAEVGHQVGTLRSFNANVTDGILNIDFYRTSANDPIINAIEIVNGSGITPPVTKVLAVSPSAVNFPDTQENTTSASQTITLSNTGNSTLTVSAINLSGSHASMFSHNGSTPISISSGGSQTVEVSFTPTSTGTKNAIISFTHDGDNSSPQSVSLSGTGTSTPPPASGVLYRINAGGDLIPALDPPNPDWAYNITYGASDFHNGPTFYSNHTVPNRDGTVPASTPQGVFQTERWDPSQWDEMKWFFDVPASGDYEVRLYFANGYNGTSQVGQRVFNVEIEGTPVLTNFDIVAEVGHQVGTMKSFVVNITDGTINIDYYRITSDPIVNAVEILAVNSGSINNSPGNPGGSNSGNNSQPEVFGLGTPRTLGIQVFPNPMKDDQLAVAFSKTVDQEITYALYDLYGKLIWKKTMLTQNQTVLDLSNVNMPAGIYLLRIGSSTSVLGQIKIQKD